MARKKGPVTSGWCQADRRQYQLVRAAIPAVRRVAATIFIIKRLLGFGFRVRPRITDA